MYYNLLPSKIIIRLPWAKRKWLSAALRKLVKIVIIRKHSGVESRPVVLESLPVKSNIFSGLCWPISAFSQ